MGITIKLHSGDELFRFSLENDTPFSGLVSYIRKFYLQGTIDLNLRYVDEEGDHVTLSVRFLLSPIFSFFFFFAFFFSPSRRRTKATGRKPSESPKVFCTSIMLRGLAAKSQFPWRKKLSRSRRRRVPLRRTQLPTRWRSLRDVAEKPQQLVCHLNLTLQSCWEWPRHLLKSKPS